MNGEPDLKCSATARIVFSGNASIVLTDNIRSNRQSEASTSFLVGKKRLEYMRHDFGSNAGTGIGNAEQDLIFVRYKLCLDGKTSARLHGFYRVHKKIQNDLTNLAGDGRHGTAGR